MWLYSLLTDSQQQGLMNTPGQEGGHWQFSHSGARWERTLSCKNVTAGLRCETATRSPHSVCTTSTDATQLWSSCRTSFYVSKWTGNLIKILETQEQTWSRLFAQPSPVTWHLCEDQQEGVTLSWNQSDQILSFLTARIGQLNAPIALWPANSLLFIMEMYYPPHLPCPGILTPSLCSLSSTEHLWVCWALSVSTYNAT